MNGNAQELITWATTKGPNVFCITGGVVELAMWQRRQPPWRWKRILPKWYVEMKKEEAMLQVKGTAEFVVGEKKPLTLKIKLQVQPGWPIEHDRLAQIAAREDNAFRMEEGNLVMEVEAPVEAEPVAEAKEAEQTPTEPPTDDSAPASESSSTPAPEEIQPLCPYHHVPMSRPNKGLLSVEEDVHPATGFVCNEANCRSGYDVNNGYLLRTEEEKPATDEKPVIN